MALEKRGVPTATIVTDQFSALAQTVAKAAGFSSLTMVIITHPLGGLKQEKVKEKADKFIDRVVQGITS